MSSSKKNRYSSVVAVGLLGVACLALNACTVQASPSNGGAPSSSSQQGAGNNASSSSGGQAAAGGLSCRQILECVENCADSDAPCFDACGEKGSVDGKAQAVALSECANEAGCQDATCVQASCAGAVNACVGAATPANPTTTPTNPANPANPADPNGAGPVVATMHAAELVREFQQNSVRANQLYGGKRVRVFGTVNSVSPDDDKTALVFKSSVTTYSQLFCRFSNDQASSLADLNTGDQATAEGTVIGIGGFTNGRLILENCTRQ